jgi:SAM-dependent methyltransferase
MLKSLLKRIFHKSRKLALSAPKKVHCNVCGWRGRRFLSDMWHPYTICPHCGSEVRHRLLIAAMQDIDEIHLDALAGGRKVLHFAPEALIGNLVAKRAASYQQADLFRESVDLKLDMCNMEAVETGTIDLLIACDVLEHVPDDNQAMEEVHRVLSPGGWAVLTVPQRDGLETTYEDPIITSEQGRLEAFGQEDHLRIYGSNFSQVLEQHGFRVRVVDELSFPEAQVQRQVLFPPVLSDHPLATNYRKVFFAQKPASSAA